jgi:hypothetical protein
MRSAVQPRRMPLQLAATIVACTIFCLTITASAQQPNGKLEGFTELRQFQERNSALIISADGSTVYGGVFRWTKSGGVEVLSGGKGNARPQVVSANGTATAGTDWAAGHYWNGNELDHVYVFLWSKAGGGRDIAKYSDRRDSPYVIFVSDDGSVVMWLDHYGKRLVRWSTAGGEKELALSGNSFLPSADGSEIAGSADGHSFRWTRQGGRQDIAAMDRPLGISADGTVILGTKGDHVIRWTQAGGAQDLGTVQTDGKTVAHLIEASADRAEIVGSLEIKAHDNVPAISHAFLWTQAGGVQDLGTLGGKSARLEGVSADGTVIVGHFVDAGGTQVAFVSSVPDLVAKSQAELKQEQAQAQAQAAAQAQAQAKAAAAQAEEDAKNAAIQADQQAR